MNRAKIVASALFETSYLFPTKSGFFTLSPFVHSGDAIRKLIDKLPVADRFIYIKEIMDTQNWNSLQIFADFLNTTELAHGRLGANGNERGFEKLISEDELISLIVISPFTCGNSRRHHLSLMIIYHFTDTESRPKFDLVLKNTSIISRWFGDSSHV